jgi:hypothetical protein
MRRIRRASPWFVLSAIFLVLSLCAGSISGIRRASNVGEDTSSNPGWFWQSGDQGQDQGWFDSQDSGSSDSGGWWDSGSDSGSWDSGGSDSGSWDSGGSDSGSWDSGGSDSGSW